MEAINKPYVKIIGENGKVSNPITKENPYQTFAPSLKRYNRRNEEVFNAGTNGTKRKRYYKSRRTSNVQPAYKRVPTILNELFNRITD